MELKTLFGLPAHPFLIHAPLVLIPLTGLVVIVVMLWKPSVRRRWTLPLAGVGLVLLVLVQLAIGSGEALKGMGDEANNPTVLQHQADADALRLILLGQTAVLLVLGLLTRQTPTAAAAAPLAADPAAASAAPVAPSLDRRAVVQGGLRVLAGGAAAATIGYTFVTGHTGATAVWQHRGEGRRPGGEGERDGSTSGFSGSNDGAPRSFRDEAPPAPPATPSSRPSTGDAGGGAQTGSANEPGG